MKLIFEGLKFWIELELPKLWVYSRLQSILGERGGLVVEDRAQASHLILQHMGQLAKVGAFPDQVLASWFWVLECCEAERRLPLDDPIFHPLKAAHLPGMEGKVFSLTGIPGMRRDMVCDLTRCLGATFQHRAHLKEMTHLIVNDFDDKESEKLSQARDMPGGKYKFVNCHWLYDCARRWTIAPEEEYGANAVSCFASVSWPARGAEGARVSKLNGKSSAQKGSPGAEPQTNGGGGKAGHAQAARRVAEENPLGKLQPLDHEGGRSAGGNPGAGGATGARKGSLGEGGGSAGGPAGKRKSGADELAAKSVAKKGRGSLGGGSAKKTPQVEWQPLIGRKVVKKFKGIPFKGEVISYDKKAKYFRVRYEDDDSEEFSYKDLQDYLVDL